MNVSQMFPERIGIIPGLFWTIIESEREKERELDQNFCKPLHHVTRAIQREKSD